MIWLIFNRLVSSPSISSVVYRLFIFSLYLQASWFCKIMSAFVFNQSLRLSPEYPYNYIKKLKDKGIHMLYKGK